MGYLLLSFFLVVLTLTSLYENRQNSQLDVVETLTIMTQRATETVQYINAINDYLYDHPDVNATPNEIVLKPDQIGMKPNHEIYHVIFKQRVYVWQKPERGLMNALKTQTLSSALLGTVKQRHLIDNSGKDMTVPVPIRIPDGAVVYLN
ncbi:type IV pilus biogenesis protein PilM [Photorhabdus heterorhabditis]|uniref:Type IV pilus biogenesis protein PilM n=1 Tax=Photorhabdus heterorhabditis TaxID=880156 RepID=A0A5B0XA47_9GAMM|nr:type IV pilus biogenesis protein PilM [Photorhabdus heterorhabditis]KAA1195465.1 type IV pilus biogenesis protein PilM [Photorhabdus heterorhabditis]MBS9441072.1 pilus assembly protein PilM [Photorhabdus heterorhabditis]